jgi:Fe-S-cluster containining protein
MNGDNQIPIWLLLSLSISATMQNCTETLECAMEPQLIAGRDCGPCNVCCVALTIDDPELQKPHGYRCRNTQRDHSCAIYEKRPQTCRTFQCSWRQLKWIRETMRPDMSGVLVRMHREISRQTGEERMGVIFMLLTKKALKAEGLAESVAAAIAAEIPFTYRCRAHPATHPARRD